VNAKEASTVMIRLRAFAMPAWLAVYAFTFQLLLEGMIPMIASAEGGFPGQVVICTPGGFRILNGEGAPADNGQAPQRHKCPVCVAGVCCGFASATNVPSIHDLKPPLGQAMRIAIHVDRHVRSQRRPWRKLARAPPV